MKWFLVSRLLLTLATSFPLNLSLQTSSGGHATSPYNHSTVTLLGDVTSGDKCDKPETSSTFLLSHDCSNGDKLQRQSVAVHTNGKGSFNTSLEDVLEGEADQTRKFCSVVLCRDKHRKSCSNAIIVLSKEGEVIDSVKQRNVKFCFFQKKSAVKRSMRQIAKRSPWSEEDLSWLKRSDTQKENYRPSENEAGVSGILHHGGSRLFSAYGERPRRLWEGAEDEVGWMKRNSGSKIDRLGDMSLGRYSPAAGREEQKKWKESDMAWL